VGSALKWPSSEPLTVCYGLITLQDWCWQRWMSWLMKQQRRALVSATAVVRTWRQLTWWVYMLLQVFVWNHFWREDFSHLFLLWCCATSWLCSSWKYRERGLSVLVGLRASYAIKAFLLFSSCSIYLPLVLCLACVCREVILNVCSVQRTSN
jgi:hypothetical protein